MTTTLQLLLALAGSHAPLVAVDSPPPAPPAPQQLRAVRLTGGQAVSIDGTLDEALWQTAERVTGFTQRDPTQGAVPTESTVVYIAYDDAALYIGARLYDSHPDSIVARLHGAIRARAPTASRSTSTPTTTNAVASTSGSTPPARSTTARSSTTIGTTIPGTVCGKARRRGTRRGGPRRCAFRTPSCASSGKANTCGASISVAMSHARTSSITSCTRHERPEASCRASPIS